MIKKRNMVTHKHLNCDEERIEEIGDGLLLQSLYCRHTSSNGGDG